MSSFNVTWKSDTKTSGKVFARKRKLKPESKNPIVSQKTSSILNDSLKETIKSKVDKQISIKKKINKFNKPQNNLKQPKIDSSDTSASTKPTKLVKRKLKKDKLLAKLAADSNQKSPVPVGKQKDHSLFSVGNKEVYVKSNTKGRSVIEEVFSGSNKFSDLDIHKYIVSNLEKIGYTGLMTVQEKSIPVVLSGKNVLVRSQTGSGKTLAYAVPILNALQSINPKLQRGDGVQAVIIVPTRELALQTDELFGKINTFQWIVVGHLCGGENRNTEKNRLRKGVHILIATPGRLLDHLLHTSSFKTDKIRCLVLDEADRLLDMGFKKDIVRIVEEIDRVKTNSEYDPMAILRGNKIKKFDDADDTDENEVKENNNEIIDGMPLANPSSNERQTILLSATLNKGIAELTDFTMKEHTYIDALEESSTINPQFLVIPSAVKQKFIVTHVKHRLFTLSALLLAQAKKSCKVFVFMGTSTMVDYHYELFTRFLAKMPKNRGKLKSGDVVLLEDLEDDSGDEEEVVMKVEFFKLHGSMEQSARKDVFTKFRAAKAGILLCTDVVARGIDVPAADCIIQYNGPQTIENYIHRVGRTGRAGNQGTSIIFLTHEEQDFITRMAEHKVFLQKYEPDEALNSLCILMEEEDKEKAALSLQRYYERAITSDKELHRLACLAYCSWSRFYNTCPGELRKIFDFKQANLGHYVTSFGLKETPTEVAKITRKQVEKVEKPRLNKKLANYEEEKITKRPQKKKIKSLSLTTSEFGSGLEPLKKKKKKHDSEEI